MRTERIRSGPATLNAGVAGAAVAAGAVSGTGAGAGPVGTVLFVNAVGMENVLLDGIAERFRAAGLNLVTWELRGSPGPSDTREVTLADHVADGVAVLDGLGIEKAHVAGWCTGASVALFLARELGERALSFSSVDGAYLFDGVPGARLGNAVFDMCAQVAKDVGQAGLYHEAMRPRGNEGTALGIEDPELIGMLTLPYRQDEEELIRFAYGIRATTTGYAPAEACAELTLPALFLARRDDEMVGYRNSARAAELVPGAQFAAAETGGHYALFTDPEPVEAMSAFMLAARVPASRA
ncbi:Putative aminoacrylate hydrolase RutD [Streptomyces avidinii]